MIEIESVLPHRPPFLWIDRILSIEPGSRCVSTKHIDPQAPFFAGHFPGDPIPGVFLIEAAAQTAGVMMGASGTGADSEKRLAAVNAFKFLRPVRPDDSVEIETELLVERDGMAVVAAVARVAGEVVAKGQLTVVSR